MVLRALSHTLTRLHSRIRLKPSKRWFLPPEVWLVVFELGDLSVDEISNVRLTCKAFAALGRSLLFSSFQLSAFVVDYPDTRSSFSKDIDSARRLERLEHWASDDIAPMVRHCKVDPMVHPTEFDTVLIEDAGRIIDAFFLILPRFLNLNELECSHLPFCDQALSQLCLLKKLKTFKVTDCYVTASVAPRPTLEVTNVHFHSYRSNNRSMVDLGQIGWLDVLHPASIRQIWISFSKPRITHLRGIATRQSLFSMPTTESDNVSRHIISIISHPSALEELKIYQYVSSCREEDYQPPKDYSLGTLSLPSLRKYEGPHQILSWVSTGPKLCSASLTTLDRAPYIPWNTLLETLQVETISNSIQTMTIHLNDIPEELLIAISARFVHIKDLKLYVRGVDEGQVSQFFERTSLALDSLSPSSSPPLCRTSRQKSKL